LDTKELLKQVRKIEIKTRRLSDHIFSGEYHSSFKGRGMSFAEVRKYQYGDDVRAIDWMVTARLNEPYIKTFEEERELTMVLMVDVSGSEFFGSEKRKREVITEICATLAFSAIQNNDKVGILFFSDKIEKFIPPKKGKQHALHIIRDLIELEPEGKGTDIGLALEYLAGIMKKKAIVFLLSDFVSAPYEKPLRVVAKKHDITGIRVYDKLEETLPNLGLVLSHDKETGKSFWLNTSSKKVRRSFNQIQHQAKSDFKNHFAKSGSGNFSVNTEESYVKQLLNYFKQRA
jgi:uncharacterized protein (DUF58 family)